MNSLIYNGKVVHDRKIPIGHRWTYPYCFYAIDLDELNELQKSVKGFGHNCWRPVALRDADYLDESDDIRKQLSCYTEIDDSDQIILITVARFLTKVFKPVSFYYVMHSNGSSKAMIAEVNNTFGERHLYVMNTRGAFPVQCSHSKAFHVSPFNDMNGHYEFSFSAPGKDLRIEIKMVRNGEVVMEAAMRGEGKELNTGNLWATLLRHPFNAAATMPRILKQASTLYFCKKLSIFKKPPPSSPMTIKG